MRLLKALSLGLVGTVFFVACTLLGVAIAAGLAAMIGPWSIFVFVSAIFAAVVAVAYAGSKPC